MEDVAQLVRAPDCDSGGRGFEPRLPPQVNNFYCNWLASVSVGANVLDWLLNRFLQWVVSSMVEQLTLNQ